ncbi:MAG: glutamine--fructose-6-phosphate transaminase (isomerizing) [Bacilli bacterium]|jgi:glucosamine--fructose-6-phosphate aminotransferase (isomerizing)|nr:glutamine--fructose-6-phosphate transaminase (isomerizing) [Bacilli bacterium]MCH4228768.1 glutamine--fructose-6-phosphate transaminase (isomerizing) [Bacilli bacterium]MCH4278362.1 glutamine--fructose-6-phosphate transaminase (isomerizing) [Bacilli bacterium]MCI2055065.1 glutamine--fructose-6-phosphate transaminase (isomerizing) [Bacilli bacterium]
MCGIVGGVGKISFRDYLLNGLRSLDYRGYDSAGLAYSKDGEIKLYKTVGRVDDLDKITPHFSGADAGIAHTRWATHGVPSTINAHPQVSMKSYFYIVHNGVVENFKALKKKLSTKGYVFKSETDTEVVADLLEFYFLQSNDPLMAMKKSIADIEGSFACAILIKGYDELYFMKRSSPLLIGVGKDANYLASDAVPMVKYANKFIDVDDDVYGYIMPSEVHLYKDGKEIAPSYVERNVEECNFDLCGYPHFMLKEIEESPSIIRRLIDNYYNGTKFTFDSRIVKAIATSDDIVFLACGTSHYASMLGVEYMHFLGKRSESYIASEWAYYPVVTAKKPVFILLSQSGETADLIACQKYINENGLTNIAITNSRGSTIDRKATFSLLLYAGLEVAVASTKSYDAQVTILAMLVAAVTKSTNAIRHLRNLTSAIEDIISRKEEIHEIAKKMVNARDAFFVGRGYDNEAALECALKLKEISYIHAEAYAGGELKHGPIALIEKETPVIGLISDPISASALRNNLEELKSRGASIFIVSTKALKAENDNFVINDVKPYLAAVAKVTFGQYLSYYVALEKGLPIDKPRNLAKSVTVQ